MRTVFCTKYKEELEGLAAPPFPSEEGTRIYEHISAKAWGDWLAHQTILINEYRLSSIDPRSREFLTEEREKFLFGEGSDLPDAFTPQAAQDTQDTKDPSPSA